MFSPFPKVKQLFKNTTREFAPKQGGYEYKYVWEGISKQLKQWAPTVLLNWTFEQVQNLEELIKYLKYVITLAIQKRHKSLQCPGAWPTSSKP